MSEENGLAGDIVGDLDTLSLAPLDQSTESVLYARLPCLDYFELVMDSRVLVVPATTRTDYWWEYDGSGCNTSFDYKSIKVDQLFDCPYI